MKTEEASAVKGLLGDNTVFYTEKGRCFHVLDCPRVSKSRGGVASAKQAIKWDLVPCRVCQPEKNVLMLYTI